MIWEWLYGQLVNWLEWLGGQLGSLVPPVPSWLSSLPAQIRTLVGWIAQGGAWFPVELLAPVLLVLLGAWVAGLAIKIARIVASFLTLGGGGAG